MRFSLVLFLITCFNRLSNLLHACIVRKSTNKGSEITNHPNQLPNRKKAIKIFSEHAQTKLDLQRIKETQDCLHYNITLRPRNVESGHPRPQGHPYSLVDSDNSMQTNRM